MLTLFVKHKLRRFIKDESGSVAVLEIAFILPLVLLLFMGAIEFGFVLKEWRRVNDLVEAQVLYLSASNCKSSNCLDSNLSNSQQLYKGLSNPSTIVLAAVAQNNSYIDSNDAVASVEFGCGCPQGNGSSATINLDMPFNSAPPYCPPPNIKTCGVNSNYYAYARVKASKQHSLFFINIAKNVIDRNWDYSNQFGSKYTFTPLLSAQALVRIY